MHVDKGGLQSWPITIITIQYRSGQSNVEAGALSRISWPKVLDGTDTVDVENMDTHIVNAIIHWY